MSLKDIPTQEPVNNGGVFRNTWVLWLSNLRRASNLLIAGSATEESLLWDDLRFPAQSINPIGAVSDPTVSTTTGLLEFSGTADNIIAGVAQMPHTWAAGTSIMPHLHVRDLGSNTNTSRWVFEYDIANRNGDFVNNYGTYTTHATVSHVNPNNLKKHSVVSFGELDMTGYEESCCMLWRIKRLASSDGADNNTSAVALIEFDIHYQKEKDGTSTVYTGP